MVRTGAWNGPWKPWVSTGAFHGTFHAPEPYYQGYGAGACSKRTSAGRSADCSLHVCMHA